MKPLKLGGACVVIAALVAMAAAAPAQSNVQSNSAAPTPPAMLTLSASQSLDPFTSAEVAAVARGGIPLQRAREAIAVQSTVEREDLINELKAALGDAYGGVWYVPAAAQLDVGVTSTAAARVAEATAVRAGLGLPVTEIPVHSSEGELLATQKRLNQSLTDLFAREEVMTQASVEDNSVHVKLGSEVPAGERARIESEASEFPVEVAVISASRPKFRLVPEARCNQFLTPVSERKPYCDPPIVAGTRLFSNSKECTVGPAVRPPGESTETYVLTSGHCVEKANESFYSFDKAAKDKEEVGRAEAFLNETEKNDADVAAIKIENKFWEQAGNIPVPPTIAEWSEDKETDPFKVTGETPPAKGAATCMSGQKSAYFCGVIKETHLTLKEIEELVEVEKTKSEEGDSGGPWVSEKEKLVQGIHKGKSGNNPVFQDLEWALKRLKEVSKLELELLTTANEKRMEKKGTTAFTCVSKAEATEGFEDAHCDNATKEKAKVKFVHEEIKAGEATKVTLNNANTASNTEQSAPTVLTGTLGGVVVEINCSEVVGTGSLTNNNGGAAMTVTGSATIEYKKCTVPKPVTAGGKPRCKVKEPIVTKPQIASFISGEDKGLEFAPEGGKPFAEITLEDNEANKCPLKGTYQLEGNPRARPVNQAGATIRFETVEGEMKLGGNKAQLSSTITMKMEGGNPITLTTTGT